GLVQANPLGPVPVKGVDEPVEVFELVGASAILRRLQAAVARGLTRFVGRQTELAALPQALEPARGGLGLVVGLRGSAAAAATHARRPEAGAAARKSGAAPAAGLRGSALDRYRDPGPARWPGRELAYGPAFAAGQLSPRVPARLGQQDLLHPAPARPAAT